MPESKVTVVRNIIFCLMNERTQIFPQLLCLATTSTQCDFPHIHPWTPTTLPPYPLSLSILSSLGEGRYYGRQPELLVEKNCALQVAYQHRGPTSAPTACVHSFVAPSTILTWTTGWTLPWFRALPLQDYHGEWDSCWSISHKYQQLFVLLYWSPKICNGSLTSI